jgi:hypothetical protein
MTDLLLEVGRWLTNPRYFVAEELILVCVVTAAVAMPALGSRVANRFERAMARLARRRALACLVAALLPVVLRVLLLSWFPAPRPEVHDEFSLLLGAETFASGRLTNPAHPLWRHFESLYIFHEPTYMTKYPPAHSMLLALGLLAGHPWIGVLFSVVLMGAALTWMLQGWVPPRWALFGGLVASLRYGLFSYWTDSYWGGTTAAIGGALVTGGLIRLIRLRQPSRQAAWMAVGAAILANRRPFEGLVLCAAAAIAVAWRFRGQPLRFWSHRLIAPALAVLIPAGCWMLYYNWRVTGDPLQTPYAHDIGRHSIIRHVMYLPLGPEPVYRHDAIRDYYRWELDQWKARHERPIATAIDGASYQWRFYFGPALSIGLFALPWAIGNRRVRVAFWLAATGLAALSFEIWSFPHYAAPWTGVCLILIVQMFRHLRLWRRHDRLGVALVRGVILAGAVALWIPPVSKALGIRAAAGIHGWWAVRDHWERHDVEARLASESGRHLVFVRYLPGRDMHREWVYNGARIDQARIVWAREMDGASNARLLQHYNDRRAWMVEVGPQGGRLMPYPPLGRGR